jgi:GT2 family glycosyltransferase
VAIVMVTHGCRDIVATALTTLAAQTEPPYELIIVDSASPDDTGEWLESHVRGAQVIRSAVNIGYGAGSNLGAERARAPLVLFMNPDVFVTPRWLRPLIDAVAWPRVGAVGPQLRYPNGVLQAAGSLAFRTGMTARYGDGDPNPDAPAYRYPRVADYVSGACLLVARGLFDRVGGFDPVFGLGYFEDTDLCFKVAHLGYRVLYVPGSVVHHVRDASGGSRTLLDTVARNHRLFEARWRDILSARPLPDFDDPSVIISARDGRAPLRILLVGSAIRRARELLRHDCRLAVTVLGDADELSRHVEVVEHCADWPAWFATRRRHYDVVAGHDVQFDGLIEATQPGASRLADCDAGDLERAGVTPWPSRRPPGPEPPNQRSTLPGPS